MEYSRVYARIHFLLCLKDASVADRRAMLTNLTRAQLQSLVEIIIRVVNGVISPMRRDAPLFERKRQLFRTFTSARVSFTRKKALLKRNHSLLPRLLRVPYLIQVILDETRTNRDE